MISLNPDISAMPRGMQKNVRKICWVIVMIDLLFYLSEKDGGYSIA